MAEHRKPASTPDRNPAEQGDVAPATAVETAVAAPDPRARRGERQDGAGVSASPDDRSDARPAGRTAAERGGRRQGTGQGTGPSEDPFAAHRGDPATFHSGAARGSGAGAGGGGAGESEEPDPDSAGGGGRL